ncbi:MAG: hypothetical protein JST91_06180 [Actinobacteria bacterium]|nr:hypothetical protein [Actinomycetota bacterium]
MKRRLSTLAGLLVGAGAAAAVALAPVASAEPYGGGGPDNPLLPQCESTGGSAVIGGQTTDCASPGNSQIDATPEVPEYGMFPWDDDFFVL